MNNSNKSSCHGNLSVVLWVFAILPPFLTIILSFILQKWDWGLMDDSSILSMGSGLVSRTWNYFVGLIAWGVFRPTFALHSGIFYTIFQNHPEWFYVFKAMEIYCILLIWGLVAYRITKETVSIFLLPTITLSFHYFYDTFFYLSSHEFLGLLFVGIALHFFLYNLETDNIGPKKFPWKKWYAGLFFLLCAFGAKEPFVSCGIALGASYLYLVWLYRKTADAKAFLTAGLLLVIISVGYSFTLFKVIKSNYTSSYGSSTVKIISNLYDWFKKDFANHLPWIIGTPIIMNQYRKKRNSRQSGELFTIKAKWGIFLGILFYLAFLFILLPWNATCYYAAPLGLFFAFIITVLISGCLCKLSLNWQVFVIIGALTINQLVCQYALNREAIYKYDTNNLMKWFSANTLFQGGKEDYCIQCNAMEASATLPSLMEREGNLKMKGFSWSTDPERMVNERKCEFYLYSPRFHGIDMAKLKGWSIVFLSRNWIMYRKLTYR